MFVNLTPHAINVGGMHIPPSGTVARCREESELVTEICGLKIIRKKFGAVEGLPPPEENTVYIVSAICMAAARRPDVMCPGNPVRDSAGVIVGCEALCCF